VGGVRAHSQCACRADRHALLLTQSCTLVLVFVVLINLSSLGVAPPTIAISLASCLATAHTPTIRHAWADRQHHAVDHPPLYSSGMRARTRDIAGRGGHTSELYLRRYARSLVSPGRACELQRSGVLVHAHAWHQVVDRHATMNSATRRSAPRVMLRLPSRPTGSDVRCGHCGAEQWRRGAWRHQHHDTERSTHVTHTRHCVHTHRCDWLCAIGRWR
jgi:hypothetical protein